jgi:hypothetical protein
MFLGEAVEHRTDEVEEENVRITDVSVAFAITYTKNRLALRPSTYVSE